MKALATLITLLALAAPSARAAATQFYGATKIQRFVQTSTAAPQIRSTQGHRAQAFVYATVATTATIRTPRAVTKNLLANGDHLAVIETFNTQGELDTPWNSGTYTISLQNTKDGSRTSNGFIGNSVYPAAPRISNFNDCQNVDHTQPFTVRWDALGIPSTDIARLRVEINGAVVFETPAIPGTTGVLGSSATSVTIPVGRLIEGEVYNAYLISHRTVTRDTTTISGAPGHFGYGAETTFTIRTRFTRLDMSYYGIEKRTHFAQTSASAPTPQADTFELAAFAIPATFDGVSAATFTPPGGSARTLTRAGTLFTFSQRFPNQANRDTAFPAGDYRVSFTTRNNGLRTNTLALTGNDTLAAPQVVNFAAAQSIQPTQPFRLDWTTPGGGPNDLVQLIIREGDTILLATPAQPGAGALTGSSVAYTIPANTLRAGRAYTGTLHYSRHNIRDTVNYLGVLGVSGFGRVTHFTLAVVGNAPAPTIRDIERLNGQTEFLFNNVPGQNYTLQFSTDLPSFSTWVVTNSATSPLTIRWPATAAPRAFYRILVGP